ncbi:hypothetical protein BHM03_00050170 [Ensete ventricosum]|nr:hypothetical protein BHM03_00050170 [Ensete ventricosum]
MTGSIKLQPDGGPRYSLGIGPSSDDVVGSRWKFVRRFEEGIEKLTGNAKGDRREEDRRTCCKIAGGCRGMRDGSGASLAEEHASNAEVSQAIEGSGRLRKKRRS